MPAYSISLDQHYNRIAAQAASETGLDVQKYINRIVREHLDQIEKSPGRSES